MYSVGMRILQRFLSAVEQGYFPVHVREHLSKWKEPARLRSAQKCSRPHARLASRYSSTQPYWLPLPFDQARRGFYYLKHLTAWARWQVCQEENNHQKQMHGISTNMSATTLPVSHMHPHQNHNKKEIGKERTFISTKPVSMPNRASVWLLCFV